MSADELQNLLRALATIGAGAFGVVLKVIWGRLENTRKDLDDLRVVLGRDYPNNSDMREFSERVARSMDRLSDQIGEFRKELHQNAIAIARSAPK